MLFAQKITLRWHKDVRYAKYAAERRRIRFRAMQPEPPAASALLLHRVALTQTAAGIVCDEACLRTFGTEAFYKGRGHNQTVFAPRIAVAAEPEGYAVYYFGMGDSAPRPVMLLRAGESGRILLNMRRVYHDTGRWYYEDTIMNFVHADPGAYRAKLFYIKEPTHSFSDLHDLQMH